MNEIMKMVWFLQEVSSASGSHFSAAFYLSSALYVLDGQSSYSSHSLESDST